VIMSRSPRRDIALLRVNAINLPAVTLADSSEVRPGELAIVIGNPLAFIEAHTTGTVHAIVRSVASARIRGYRPTSDSHRVIRAVRLRTRAVELSRSTRWLQAVWHSQFRVTRCRIFLLRVPRIPGSVWLSIRPRFGKLRDEAGLSDWLFSKSSPAVPLPTRRSCRVTYYSAQKKNRLRPSMICRRSWVTGARVSSASNFSAEITCAFAAFPFNWKAGSSLGAALRRDPSVHCHSFSARARRLGE
jgi:hypothetical protein